MDDLQGLKEHLQAYKLESNPMLGPQQVVVNAQNLLLHVLAILFASRFLTPLCSVHQVPAEEGRSHTPRGNSAATPALSLPTSILPYPTDCQAYLRCFKHMRRAPKNIEIRTICWPESHLVRYM